MPSQILNAVSSNLNHSTVDNQLNTLIALYEEEKVRLQKLITECLAEEEYLLAHYHFNALFQLNGKLQTLHNIDDNLYDNKQFKLRSISILEKQLEETDSQHMKEYFSKELFKAKEALEGLNQTPSKTGSEKITPLLDDILNRLLHKKVKNVKLILKKEDNFFLAFVYSNKSLKVTLPCVKQHVKNWILHDEKVHTFRHLGFKITDNGSKLILTLTGDKREILNKLNTILSKIVFELFYFKDFKNQSYIQYTDKVTR